MQQVTECCDFCQRPNSVLDMTGSVRGYSWTQSLIIFTFILAMTKNIKNLSLLLMKLKTNDLNFFLHISYSYDMLYKTKKPTLVHRREWPGM